MSKTGIAVCVALTLWLVPSSLADIVCPGIAYVGVSTVSFGDSANASANCAISSPSGSVSLGGTFLGNLNINFGIFGVSTETVVYNTQGQVVRFIDGNGVAVSFPFNPFSNERLLYVTDPEGNNSTAFTYDAAGRVIGAGLNGVAYDASGRVTAQGYGLPNTYTYDSAGHLVKSTEPFGHTTTFTYDSSGRLLTANDSQSGTSQYFYDTQGRLLQWFNLSAQTGARYTYDSSGREISEDAYTFYTETLTHYTYDQHGNLVSISTSINGQTPPSTSQFGYDLNGELNGYTDPSGMDTLYFYDNLSGELLSTYNPFTQTGSKFTYDADGNIASITDPQGDTTSFVYELPPVTTPAPEPGTLMLLASGLAGLITRRRLRS